MIAVAGIAACTAGDGSASDSARFNIRTEVINPDLRPITATIGGFGAGARFVQGGGFEPVVWRNRLQVTEDAEDRVVAHPSELSAYGQLKSGALDGAEVEVLRVVDGVMRVVRRDHVPAGGHHVDAWEQVFPTGQLVPPAARSVEFAWPRGWRAGAETWFSLRAVGPDGALSARSTPAVARSPDRPGSARPSLIHFAQKLQADSGSAAPAAPTALTTAPAPGDNLRLTWSSPWDDRIVGWLVERVSIDPAMLVPPHLALAGGSDGPPLRKGDMVFVRKRFMNIDPLAVVGDRVWNTHLADRMRPGPIRRNSGEQDGVEWRLRAHGPDTPVESAGRTYLELSLPGRRPFQIGRAGFGGLDQTWYEVLEQRPYRMEAWVRADSPVIGSFRVEGGWRGVRPMRFQIGPEWRKVSAEFTPPNSLEKGVGRFLMEFIGPGTVSVDNFRVMRADTPYLDYTIEEYARLKESGMDTLRTHAFIKTGYQTYDLDALTRPAGAGVGAAWENTLPQTLSMIETAGMNPWLQVEMHFSEEEWLGLVEYLAAPAGAGPWADRRAAQGHVAPWADVFGHIQFEISNETWNRLFHPWVFPVMTDGATERRYSPGEVYGLFQERVIGVLRSSPWWSTALEEKVEFVIGGWNRFDYGVQAARMSPSSELMTVGAYNGGWDENQGPPTRRPQSYFNVLNQVSQAAAPNARRHVGEMRALSAARGTPIHAGTYEAGPGYALNGLNGQKVTPEQAEAQEQVMKSQAAGVATLDSFLAMAAAGYQIQNIFTFSEGRNWSSHAEPRNGGHAYPHWKLLTLLNREGLGDMLAVDTLESPQADLAPVDRMMERVEGAPLIAAYATRARDRLNLFVISRRVPGIQGGESSACTPVEVDLPIRTAKTLTVHSIAGQYDAHNVNSDTVKIKTRILPVPEDASRLRVDADTGATDCGLPAASVILYVFEGVQ